MATILTVGNSEGSRRCDSTCHKAKKPKCVCVCGGRYHGTGSTAVSQELLTRDWLGDELTDELKAAKARGETTIPKKVWDVIKQRTSGLAART